MAPPYILAGVFGSAAVQVDTFCIVLGVVAAGTETRTFCCRSHSFLFHLALRHTASAVVAVVQVDTFCMIRGVVAAGTETPAFCRSHCFLLHLASRHTASAVVADIPHTSAVSSVATVLTHYFSFVVSNSFVGDSCCLQTVAPDYFAFDFVVVAMSMQDYCCLQTAAPDYFAFDFAVAAMVQSCYLG